MPRPSHRYLVLLLRDAGVRLHSRHLDSGPAFSADRTAEAPAALVRVDGQMAMPCTVLAAKGGPSADQLQEDAGFCRTARELAGQELFWWQRD